MCLVEVKKAKNAAGFLHDPVSEGMEVFTNTARVLEGRRNPGTHLSEP
jgi:NADH dehydrogenase/NADH:ubiquinone oxidoreductase subunit G